MAALAQLVSELRRLEELASRCMRCGLCQAACPLYRVTGLEPDVARGKLALISGLLENRHQDGVGAGSRLGRCLLCGSCQLSCPSGVETLEIFYHARAAFAAYRRLSGVERWLARLLVLHHRRLFRLAPALAALQRLFPRRAPAARGRLRLPGKVLSGCHWRPPVGPSSRPHYQGPQSQPPAGPTVAIFRGCLVALLFPEQAALAAAAIRQQGWGVVVPPAQSCCGMPPLAAGDQETFARLVASNLRLFASSPVDYLVSTCPTCVMAIKHLWPQVATKLDRRLGRQAEQLAAKCYEVSQLLVDVAGLPPSTAPAPDAPTVVTYHDPCHLKNCLGVTRAPRSLLAANPAYRFQEPAEPDGCCGCGGAFALRHPKLSTAIGRQRIRALADTGATVIATTCPACHLQLEDLAAREGLSLPVVHPLQIYTAALEPPPNRTSFTAGSGGPRPR